MRCSHCSSDLPPGQSVCPHCGTAATKRSFGARRPALLILVCFFILALAGSGVYLLFAKFRLRFRSLDQPPATREVPVEHGSVVRPDELQPHGELYFVPMGRQAISAKELANYYKEKFNVKAIVLREVAIEPSACMPSRNQCIAEEMMIAAQRAYPTRKRDSVMIVLTDEDIYPRSLGWDFTYSFRSGHRVGIVSTRRMDPASWGDPSNPDLRLASTKQMLTKYVAFMYLHIPVSYDPSSIMYQPFTPNGGSDDLHESDIHSEESANGQRGSDWPCLAFVYSYASGELKPYSSSPADCDYAPEVSSVDEEIIEVDLGRGQFADHAMDLQPRADSRLEFRRGYLSRHMQATAMGWGTNHNYNSWLYSDGAQNLTFMDIIHEDGSRDHLERLSPGRGFSSSVVFESHDDGEEIYGARMTWDQGHFKLQYRDGSWSTYLPCSDGRCYWTGSQDSEGHVLDIHRTGNLDLQSVSWQNNKVMDFQSDASHRIIEARDAEGHRVAYEYSSDGCLAQVHRADGQTTLYTYDSGHRMTGISVVRAGAERPRVVVTNEYNSLGQLTRYALADGRVYEMTYGPEVDGFPGSLALKEPSGRVLNISLDSDSYRERAESVKYPAKPQ
jgi:YD repeat-containing protein